MVAQTRYTAAAVHSMAKLRLTIPSLRIISDRGFGNGSYSNPILRVSLGDFRPNADLFFLSRFRMRPQMWSRAKDRTSVAQLIYGLQKDKGITRCTPLIWTKRTRLLCQWKSFLFRDYARPLPGYLESDIRQPVVSDSHPLRDQSRYPAFIAFNWETLVIRASETPYKSIDHERSVHAIWRY